MSDYSVKMVEEGLDRRDHVETGSTIAIVHGHYQVRIASANKICCCVGIDCVITADRDH